MGDRTKTAGAARERGARRAALAAAAVGVLAACSTRGRDDGRADDAPPDAGLPAPAHAGPVASGARPAGAPRAACGDLDGAPASVTVGTDGRSFAVACDGGATLGVAVVDDGVVRLRYGATAPPSGMVTPPAAPPDARVGRDLAGRLVVCAPSLILRVDPARCRVRAESPDHMTLLDDGDAGGRVGDAIVHRAEPGERFFGLGLRAGASLDRRGSAFDFWNTDAYDDAAKGFRPDADPLYESIPFYVALRGAAAYGVLVDDPRRLRFDLARARSDEVRVTAFTDGSATRAAPPGDQYVVAGPLVRDVLRRYARLTGAPALPPRWALGYQHSRWEAPCDGAPAERPMCSAAQVLELARTFRAKEIPADGLWLDIQHMDGFRSFTWDRARFADPAALARDLAGLGFTTTIIVDPGIKVDPAWPVYQSGLAAGHFLRDAEGKVYVGEVWPGPATFPDFSAPATRAWWSELVRGAAAAGGVRGAWIDMNEPSDFAGPRGTVPDTLVARGDGAASTMAEVHNLYAAHEARATYEGLAAAHPGKRPFVLSRAAFAGQQRWSAVWTGDAPSTWTTLRATLPMLLGLGLSGMPIAGSDVGGYSGREEATAELYARWMQLGALSPFFRGHAERDARRQEPWSFGEEALEVARAAIGLRYELLPYLYSLAHEANAEGTPILRPLVLEAQGEPALADVADEAMLGPHLLAAPVLEAGARARTVVLPRGRWVELASGALHEGGGAVRLTAGGEPLPLAAFPLFVREGAIVPRAPRAQHTGALAGAPLLLDVVPGARGSFALVEDDGESLGGATARTTLTTDPLPGGTAVRASARAGAYAVPARAVIARLLRVDAAPGDVTLDGKALARVGSRRELVPGTFTWDADELSVSAMFADAAPFELVVQHEATRPSPAPPVRVPVTVRLPPGTPADAPITIASSASGWTHAPLARAPGADVATGFLEAPRGTWIFYKVTRGGWPTVEKAGDCTERPNRTAHAAPGAPVALTVARWADGCR